MQQLIDFLPPSGVSVMPAPYRAGVHPLSTPQAVEQFLRSVWQQIEIRESFYAVFLNQSLKPCAWAKIADGGIDKILIDTRILFKYAIDCTATAIIVAHNHPSGKM